MSVSPLRKFNSLEHVHNIRRVFCLSECIYNDAYLSVFRAMVYPGLCGYLEGATKKNFKKRIKNLFVLIFRENFVF